MSAVIRDVLGEANASQFFQANAIELALTKDYPETVSSLAEWQYNDWRLYDTSLTIERLRESFQKQLQNEGLPFTIVALKNGAPIASIGLKEKSAPELSDLPGPWPGSFHVVANERGRGLGKALGKVLLDIVKRLGYKQVTFYTSNPDNVPLYKKMGATVQEQARPFRNHTITVMKIALS